MRTVMSSNITARVNQQVGCVLHDVCIFLVRKAYVWTQVQFLASTIWILKPAVSPHCGRYVAFMRKRAMVRIAIGGIYHETNTFVAGTTSLADFRAYQFAVKAEMLAYQGTRSEIGGFLDGCEARSWEPTLSIFAAAVPGGPVDNDA